MSSPEVRVLHYDHSGSDRHVAAYGWESTKDNDQEAFEVPEARIAGFLRFLMRGSGPYKVHASPFGHPVLTVHATNVPLFVAHQWERHRVQTYSEKSFRYVDGTGSAYVPKPEHVRRQVGKPGAYTFEPLVGEVVEDGLTIVETANLYAFNSYSSLLELGWARELARTVLPIGTLTRMYATASLRNWLNYLVLRDDDHAQLEIRLAAIQIREILCQFYPLTVSAWEELGRPQL